MKISDRQLDRLRLGELKAEEAAELMRALQEAGEMHRLDALIADADAYLEHYPPGPATQQIREEARRVDRKARFAAAQRPEPRGSVLAPLGLTLAALFVVVFSFWPKPPPPPASTAADAMAAEVEFIKWERADIDCVGEANCRADAIGAYRIGVKLVEQAGADITNPYQAYKQLELAEKLLEKGGVAKLPDEMVDVATQKARLKDGMDTKFRQSKVNYLNLRKRRMHQEMAEQLTKLQAYFPDERCVYNQWAVNEERAMKEEGVYPDLWRRK